MKYETPPEAFAPVRACSSDTSDTTGLHGPQLVIAIDTHVPMRVTKWDTAEYYICRFDLCNNDSRNRERQIVASMNASA
jgi:hypothetical protein